MSFIEAARAARREYEAQNGTTPAPQAAPQAPATAGTTEDTPYGIAALQGECGLVAAAPEGTRNDTLNRAAFRLGRIIASGQLTSDTTRNNLWAAARTAGLHDTEIAKALRGGDGGLQAGQQHPRAIPEREPQDPFTAWEPPAATNSDPAGAPPGVDDKLHAAVLEHLPRLDWKQLWDQEDDEEWIIEPLVPARRLIALYSAPKVGKSLLMLEIAVGIARGTYTLGVTPDRPRRVLYVDFENDPRGDVRDRLQAMQLRPEHLDDLYYLSFPRLAALDSERGGKQLLAAALVYGCEVVVIDTVSRSVAGEENVNDTWLAFYRHTGIRLKAAGITLVRLDHTGKDEAKGQRGGSAKVGDVDAVWRLSKLDDGTFQLECEANRLPIAEKILVLRRGERPLHHDVDATGRAGLAKRLLDRTIADLDELNVPLDDSVRAAGAKLRDAGRKSQQKVLAEAIKARRMRFEAPGS